MRWLECDEYSLRKLYPNYANATLAAVFGVSEFAISNKAQALGLRKSESFLAAYRFEQGHIPRNKGVRRPGWAPGNMAATQFKTGRPACEARNYLPIGTLKVNADGYLVRKVTDAPSLAPVRRWVPVHRLVWEEANGPIPAGHAVVFQPGCRTTDPDQITLDKLELITRAELMRRNTINRYPPELKSAIRLVGKAKRALDARCTGWQGEHEQQVPTREPLMPFYVIDGQQVHINFGRGKAPAPCVAQTLRDDRLDYCYGISVYLCDWQVSGRKTCDAALCPAHAREVGRNRHYCPMHHAEGTHQAPQLDLFTRLL